MSRYQVNERERALQEKLRHAEQHIRHLREEHHTAEEDLRAANEELQSLNEEYRSTTEELETSKEELQSINEELQTVNGELKSKLEEVSRAHNDLENLMAAADIATLFLDRNLCIKRFTPQLADLFNVKSYDLGRSIGDITHRLDYEGLEHDARTLLAKLAPIEREVAARDGRSFLMRLRPYRTTEDRIEGVVVTLLDVTELKEAEEVLRDSEERFRALVAASAQMVWTTDPSGRIFEDSTSSRSYTGQTRDDWLAKGWLGAVHSDDAARVEEAWQQSLRSKSVLHAELRMHHASSRTYRWMAVRAVPLWGQDGQAKGWVGMNMDVTELKQAEAELREQDRRKDEFLAMLGHELRNPLAAIRNRVDLVKSLGASEGFGLPDAVRSCLEVVDRQSAHMSRLVNDLLDVTRVTHDALPLHRKPTDVVACMRDVIASLQPQLDSGNLTLARAMPASPLHVDADPERLAQILGNLLHNAVNFTPPGGTVSVRIRRTDSGAEVTVRDTGIGMQPEEIETLFQPYRTAKGVSGRGGGLGLGLTLAKRLVNLHGGTISAQSRGAGRGTEFKITIPLASTGPDQLDAQARPVTPRRILVVDDDADVANAFGEFLEILSQQVLVIHDSKAAVDAARAFEPEVAFLDLSMPGLDGYELARRLRAELPRQLTLVALSGYDRSSRGAGGKVDRFDYHLLKPATPDKVRELLESLPVQGRPSSSEGGCTTSDSVDRDAT